MSAVSFEDITENMDGNPDVEAWTSVVDGMSFYRVWEDENNIIVYTVDKDGNQSQANEHVQDYVLRLMEVYHG